MLKARDGPTLDSKRLELACRGADARGRARSAPEAFGEPKTKKSAAKSDAKPDANQMQSPRRRNPKPIDTWPPRRRSRKQLDAYWDDIATKRRARMAKRRAKQATVLEDYVLTQPPVYSGPSRPAGLARAAPRAGRRQAAADPARRRFHRRRGGALQVRAAASGERDRVQARLCAGRRSRPASPRIRRSASTRSRPAATAPTTCRPG